MNYAFSYSKIKLIFVLLFCGGIVAGTIFINLNSEIVTNDLHIYYSYISEKYSWTKIEFEALFKYVLGKRIKEILLLMILGLTTYKIIFHSFFLLYQGIKMAVVISVYVFLNGTSGILYYFLIYCIPQVIFASIVVSIINKMDFREKDIVKTDRLIIFGKWILAVVGLAFLESGINILLFSKIV